MKSLITLSCALFLFSCASTPTTQISTFGQSAKAITESVDAVMTEYNDAALERSYTDYAVTFNAPGAPSLTRDQLGKIAQPITAAQRKTFAIYRANKALGSYALALAELANAISRDDIDRAAAELYGSMVSLNEQYAALTESKAQLFTEDNFAGFAKAISAIGHMVVEKKRRDAIKKIVTQADPHIIRICDTIVEQLKSAGMEDAIAASRTYVLAEEVLDYNDRVKPSSTLEWKRNQIKRLHGLQQDLANSKLTVQQAVKAIEAVKKTHGIVAKEVSKNRFTSAEIAAAVGKLKALEQHYNDFEELLLSCTDITSDSDGVLSCND